VKRIDNNTPKMLTYDKSGIDITVIVEGSELCGVPACSWKQASKGCDMELYDLRVIRSACRDCSVGDVFKRHCILSWRPATKEESGESDE